MMCKQFRRSIVKKMMMEEGKKTLIELLQKKKEIKQRREEMEAVFDWEEMCVNSEIRDLKKMFHTNAVKEEKEEEPAALREKKKRLDLKPNEEYLKEEAEKNRKEEAEERKYLKEQAELEEQGMEEYLDHKAEEDWLAARMKMEGEASNLGIGTQAYEEEEAWEEEELEEVEDRVVSEESVDDEENKIFFSESVEDEENKNAVPYTQQWQNYWDSQEREESEEDEENENAVWRKKEMKKTAWYAHKWMEQVDIEQSGIWNVSGIQEKYTPCKFFFKARHGCQQNTCDFSHNKEIFRKEPFADFLKNISWEKKERKTFAQEIKEYFTPETTWEARKKPRWDEGAMKK